MKQEIRTYSVALRAVLAKDKDDAELFALEGVAASYSVRSVDLGGFTEVIAPGAFDRSLREGHDVLCLLNHDHNHVLGRTKSGTLRLFSDERGLNFRCQLDKDSAAHRSLYNSVKRGDLDQCSFAFSVPDGGDDWTDSVDDRGQKCILRTLRNVNLRDVSVVTRPAYAADGATSVDARATSDSAVDAFNRRRAAEIGREIEADFQRRIAAAGEAVRAAALKDLGIKLK